MVKVTNTQYQSIHLLLFHVFKLGIVPSTGSTLTKQLHILSESETQKLLYKINMPAKHCLLVAGLKKHLHFTPFVLVLIFEVFWTEVGSDRKQSALADVLPKVLVKVLEGFGLF